MLRYDLIVVGGGVMGCATAYQLAKRGRRVLLLEQFARGHERGSSHGHSRIIRLAYDRPDYVRLAQAAFPLWRVLEHESGAALMLQTGGLDFAQPGTRSFEDTRATLAALGIEHEQLDAAALGKRFPQFQLPDDTLLESASRSFSCRTIRLGCTSARPVFWTPRPAWPHWAPRRGGMARICTIRSRRARSAQLAPASRCELTGRHTRPTGWW
jgi:hypothetical protein